MSGTEWAAFFDRLERELDDAELIAEPWHPPTTPMPAEFADRARALLLRQQDRIADIRRQQDAVAHQLVTLRRVPDARADASAYLDVVG
ncbi:hypothetical protein [Microbacterium sp. AR7-10]|uniref:hypothetical protein n=1 Tax=Microbacterium sp. AR7-10 TaxID=1891970 RepID=UPI0008FCDC08|nr:hypothetical protein [Microbacterium sp. AR7-10]MEE2815960.1 hypothetical protein [Actinomycetota bacterium]OIU85845.1 hypothetical protein BFN01_12185 [Microbacterium sp. AR7-10]